MSEKLLKACEQGDINQIKNLLSDSDKKIDIHYKNSFGMNALMRACWYKRLNIIEYLLTSNDLKEYANLYDKNKYGHDVLIVACIQDHTEIAEYLIINQNMKIDKETMDWLIENEHKNVLEMIETRDFYQKLNSNFPENNTITKKRKI